MSSPFINTHLLTYTGTGNVTGTLDTTGSDTDELTSGVWMVWADQAFYMQLNTATGGGIGAAPAAWPKNYPVIVSIGEDSRFLGIKRIDTDGTYYANKITQGEV